MQQSSSLGQEAGRFGHNFGDYKVESRGGYPLLLSVVDPWLNDIGSKLRAQQIIIAAIAPTPKAENAPNQQTQLIQPDHRSMSNGRVSPSLWWL